MFLTKEELKSASVPEVIDKVINNDAEIVEIIIGETEAIMKSYLDGQYEVDAIFNATGDDRNKIVMKYLKDIVVYEIYTRKTHGIDEVALKRYDEAMLWLQHVAKGMITPNLPKPEDTDADSGTGDGFIKYGGNTNYVNRF